jgi:hypothetical protein
LVPAGCPKKIQNVYVMSFSEIWNGWFIYALLSLPVKDILTGNDRKKISLLPLLPLLTFTRHFWVDRLL